MKLLWIPAFAGMTTFLHADSFWQKVTWETPDGVRLVGEYHPAMGSGAYTWILLHGLGSNKAEWDSFARKLAPKGPGIFIYDMRGHGESIHTANGGTLSYKDWRTAGPGTPWAAMPSDLAGAVQKLEKRYGVPEAKIAVGGASLGANVALVYAAAHKSAPGLILLSSGAEYAGINILDDWHKWDKRPVFAAASPEDTYAYKTLQYLVQQRPDLDVRAVEGPGGHGVNMFQDPGFEQKLLDWMNTLNGNRHRRTS